MVEKLSSGAEGRYYDLLMKPLEYHDPSMADYHELDPEQNGNPTPLDPFSLSIGNVNYPTHSRVKITNRIDQAIEYYGVPDDIAKMIYNEAQYTQDLRNERNSQSMQRLRNTIEHHLGDRIVDDAMHDIIAKARAGTAAPAELLRLIKEYPEMIAVEFYKFTKPLDREAMALARYTSEAMMLRLAQPGGFLSAEIKPLIGKSAEVISRTFSPRNNVYVEKRRIGIIGSSTSNTEAIIKCTYIASPALDGAALRHAEDAEEDHQVDYQLVRVADGTLVVALMPVSVSAYFRAADYAERQGYTAPEQRSSIEASYQGTVGLDSYLGDVAINNPEMRAVYCEHFKPGLWDYYEQRRSES